MFAVLLSYYGLWEPMEKLSLPLNAECRAHRASGVLMRYTGETISMTKLCKRACVTAKATMITFFLFLTHACVQYFLLKAF